MRFLTGISSPLEKWLRRWCLEPGKRGYTNTSPKHLWCCEKLWGKVGKETELPRRGKNRRSECKAQGNAAAVLWLWLATGCSVETTKRSKWNIFHEKEWTDEWQEGRLTSSFPKKSVHETPYRTKPKVISRLTVSCTGSQHPTPRKDQALSTARDSPPAALGWPHPFGKFLVSTWPWDCCGHYARARGWAPCCWALDGAWAKEYHNLHPEFSKRRACSKLCLL